MSKILYDFDENEQPFDPEELIADICDDFGYHLVAADPNSSFSGAFLIDGRYVYLKQVMYNNPATICIWSDGTKTISKCSTVDTYSREAGLAICIMKKFIGGTNSRKLLNQWYSDGNTVTLKSVRAKEKQAEKLEKFA